MSEIEFESNNKEVLEKCCLVVEYHQNKAQSVKLYKRETRLSIEAILEQKALREDLELYG